MKNVFEYGEGAAKAFMRIYGLAEPLSKSCFVHIFALCSREKEVLHISHYEQTK